MPTLPSGIHIAINSSPLANLLREVERGNGLFIPDVLLIHRPDDLRRYIGLVWLLPIGADCAVDQPFHRLTPPLPTGLTQVQSEYTMLRLPEYFDERDRDAIEQFWQSPRCRAFMDEEMEKVRAVQRKVFTSPDPENSYLSEWFSAPCPPCSTPPPGIVQEDSPADYAGRSAGKHST